MSHKTATIAGQRLLLGRFRLTQARREAIAFHLFAAPWIIGFLGFTLGPMIASFLLSFTAYDIITPARWVGFDNYRTMFTSDGLVWHALRVTLMYSLVAVPLGLVISFLVALLLNQRVRGIYLYRTLFYLPAILPQVPVALLWMWIFNPQFGILNNFLALVRAPQRRSEYGYPGFASSKRRPTSKMRSAHSGARGAGRR